MHNSIVDILGDKNRYTHFGIQFVMRRSMETIALPAIVWMTNHVTELLGYALDPVPLDGPLLTLEGLALKVGYLVISNFQFYRCRRVSNLSNKPDDMQFMMVGLTNSIHNKNLFLLPAALNLSTNFFL